MPEKNFWTLWCNGRLTEANALTIRLDATPSGLTSAHLHYPPTENITKQKFSWNILAVCEKSRCCWDLLVSSHHKWNSLAELCVVARNVAMASSMYTTLALPWRPPASIVTWTHALVHCQQSIHRQNDACDRQQNCQHQLHVGAWRPNLYNIANSCFCCCYSYNNNNNNYNNYYYYNSWLAFHWLLSLLSMASAGSLKETYGDWYREIITCRLSFLTVNNETLKVQYNTDGFSILVQCHVCVLQQWQWRCNNMSDPLPGWTSYKAIKPGFSLLHVSFCCVRFSFFSNKVSDWLGNTSEMTYFCLV